eukprot:c43542_g1_i1 orf=266-1651(-)
MASFADRSRARKVLMGTCGWSDHTLMKCGKFYPGSVHTSEDRLRHYSTHFPCVEVDTTTYAIPSKSSIARWLQCVPKGFLFHFKAFGLFCSKSCPVTALPIATRSKLSVECLGSDYISLYSLPSSLRDELWQVFNQALKPVHDAGSLGVVVFQFHLSFKPTEENREHVNWCRLNLDSQFSMAVEFRCREWFAEDHLSTTLEWLKMHGISLIAADELQHETFVKDRCQTGLPGGKVQIILPIAWAVTQPDFVYIRVHRREGNLRLLSEAELSVWESRLKIGLSEDLKGPIYFMWGTDWEDQPIINARNLSLRLAGMVFNWKIAQEGISQKGSLKMFLIGSQALPCDKHAKHAIKGSCSAEDSSISCLETKDEMVPDTLAKEEMVDWYLRKDNLQISDGLQSVVLKRGGKCNLKSTCELARDEKQHVRKASPNNLSVKQKQKKLKPHNRSSIGSIPITLYFEQ